MRKTMQEKKKKGDATMETSGQERRRPQLLGSGSFGVVYRPFPIHCEATRHLAPPFSNYIGKLSTPDKIRPEEMKAFQKVRSRFDPRAEFTSPLYAICDSHSSRQESSLWKGNSLEFVYGYVGVSWDKYNLQRIQSNAFCVRHLFESFGILLKGIQSMIDHKIVHADIKLANLTYDIRKNRTFLIDYDLMISSAHLESQFPIRFGARKVIYPVWPPEINFGLLPNTATRYNARSSLWTEYTAPYGSSLSFLDPTEKRVSDLLAFLTSPSFKTLNRDRVALEYWAKLDIYSLGWVWIMLFGNVHRDIFRLSMRMTDPNFKTRIDIATLRSEFQRIVFSFHPPPPPPPPPPSLHQPISKQSSSSLSTNPVKTTTTVKEGGRGRRRRTGRQHVVPPTVPAISQTQTRLLVDFEKFLRSSSSSSKSIMVLCVADPTRNDTLDLQGPIAPYGPPHPLFGSSPKFLFLAYPTVAHLFLSSPSSTSSLPPRSLDVIVAESCSRIVRKNHPESLLSAPFLAWYHSLLKPRTGRLVLPVELHLPVSVSAPSSSAWYKVAETFLPVRPIGGGPSDLVQKEYFVYRPR